MNKFDILNKLKNYGDSLFVTSQKEAFLCTTDFNNAYIKRFGRRKFNKKEILTFSWTDNGFRSIQPETVVSITPLEKILNNPKPTFQ